MKAKHVKSGAEQRPFPIVGVGASAGGLEAFTQLLTHLPNDTGMGFVLVQHLNPVHESELTRILARATSMPTREVKNNLRVKPDHVYVIPPNANMSIVGGILKLEPRPEGRSPHRSIDFFLESLARDRRERAIGVILSGTATDGTLGLEAIKAEGGITFAQDGSAKQDSMPRSAVAAGCADFVLAPSEIAAELARIATHPYVTGVADLADGQRRSAGEKERESAVAHERTGAALPSGGRGTPRIGARRVREEAQSSPEPADDGFKKVLSILRAHCGVDFSLYKSSTIQRRVARRVVLSKHNTLDDYAAFLQGNAAELDTLFSDVLISVTSFFRNPEAFEVLKQTVFPRLFEQWNGSEPVRIWVLGCSTGQEAYSIAMAFAEFSEPMTRIPKLQIFATDLNEALLEKARSGLYAKTLAQDISPERLRRFFVDEQAGYRVIKPLREQIVFARQNLISDPPFSRMDLISCRNLLIYLEPELQKRIIPSFHYALKADGFLWLGASESVGQFADLFEGADKKQKVFRKKAAPAQMFHVPLGGERNAYVPRQRKVRADDESHGALNAEREADRFAINQFAPPSVLINADLQIVQFRGATSTYLEPPSGRASFDVLKMARRGLMLPLRAAINKAKKANDIVRTENVRIDPDGDEQRINIRVVPLKNLKERCFLILFEPVQSSRRTFQRVPAEPARRQSTREETRRIAELERELAELRDYQQSIQEQSEATNEELQASNEEVQSANEELQSINEELETSKEELESTNEELTTVNEEMGSRNTELHRLNADVLNLQANIDTAIVLLGRDLSIRRFTARAEKILGLMANDLGRSFGRVRHHLRMPGSVEPSSKQNTSMPDTEQTLEPFSLEATIADVIDRVSGFEEEVQDHDGCWYFLRIRPYMSLDNKVDGAVLMLTDIDTLKRSEQAAKSALAYVRAILHTTPSPLLVLDGNLTVDTANDAFGRLFKVRSENTEGRSLLDLGAGAWRNPQLLEQLKRVLSEDGVVDDFEVMHDFPYIGPQTMLLSARRLQTTDGKATRILLSIENVTERKRAEEVLRDADHRKDEFLAMLAHELRNPLTPISNAVQMLQREPGGAEAVRATAEMMSRQVLHMARLIDDLLDASRITRGRIRLQRRQFALGSVIRDAVEVVRPLWDSRELTVSLPPEPLHVDADPLRLLQVVGNLLSNARKFTAPGGHISLVVEREANTVDIRVRDDGIGMARDQIPRIFEMFTQLDTSLERSTSGLGIGLALAKSLVEMHGGSLQAKSAGEDKGSEFIVRLPLAPKPISDSLPTSIETASAPELKGRRILVADDNRDLATSLAGLLEMAGNTTQIAENGMEAVELAESFRPEIVILDIGMPQLNGYEAARQIRNQSWAKDIVLIALTGWGQEQARQESKDAGFDGHLAKPADFAAITKIISETQRSRVKL